jgi:RHS repeat-associated protein
MKFVYLAVLSLGLAQVAVGQCFIPADQGNSSLTFMAGYPYDYVNNGGSHYSPEGETGNANKWFYGSSIKHLDLNFETIPSLANYTLIRMVGFGYTAQNGYSACVDPTVQGGYRKYYAYQYSDIPSAAPNEAVVFISTIDHGFVGSSMTRYFDSLGAEYEPLTYSWNVAPLADQDECGCTSSSCATKSGIGSSKYRFTPSNVPGSQIDRLSNNGIHLEIPLSIDVQSRKVNRLTFRSQSVTNPGNVVLGSSNIQSGFLFEAAGGTVTNPNPQTKRIVKDSFITEVVQSTIVPSRTTITVKKGATINASNVVQGGIVIRELVMENAGTGLAMSFNLTETMDGKTHTTVYTQPALNTWVMLSDNGSRRMTRTDNVTRQLVFDNGGNPVLLPQIGPNGLPVILNGVVQYMNNQKSISVSRVVREKVEEKRADGSFEVTSDEETHERPISEETWQTLKKVMDPNGKKLTTFWVHKANPPFTPPSLNSSFDQNAADLRTFSLDQLESETRPDGSKTEYFYSINPTWNVSGDLFSAYRFIIEERENYGGTTKSTITYRKKPKAIPGLTIVKINGQEILRRERTVDNISNETITEKAPNGTVLSTTIKAYGKQINDGGATYRFMTWRKHADGTITATREFTEGGFRKRRTYEGAPDIETSGKIITSGTITNITYNEFGQEISMKVEDVNGTTKTTTDEWLATATDAFGRPTLISHFPTISSQSFTTSKTYGCCGVENETDRTGITTYYAYDEQKRVIKTHRLGITTETLYNGLTTSTHRYNETVSGFLPAISAATAANEISRTVQNLAGDITESWERSAKDGALIATTMNTTYAGQTPTPSLPANIGRNVITTYPIADGETTAPTSTQEYFKGGEMAATNGQMSPTMRYDYSADASGLFDTQSYVDTDGTTLRETTVTRKDGLGRSISTSQAAGTTAPAAVTSMIYNTLGQLISSTDPDGVVTLSAYDSRGRKTTTALDLDKNGVIDPAVDRVNITTYSTALRGGIPVNRTTIAISNNAGTGTQIVRETDESVNGMATWTTEFPAEANPITTSSITDMGTPGDGCWGVTTVNRDGTKSIQTYTDGTLDLMTAQDKNSATLYTTSYTYDSLDRLTTTADSRTQPITQTYVSDVTDVVKTQFTSAARTTTYSYDQRGRLTATDAPDTLDATGAALSNITTTRYYPSGQTQEINGGQTYRTSYTYDYAQRMATLTTYGTQTAVTRWLYDPQRGLLQQKLYHSPTPSSGTGTSYTYTAGGKLKTRTSARNLTTTYSYDPAHGLLSGVNYQDPATPDFSILSRDRLGHITGYTDAAGTHTTAYTSRGYVDGISTAGTGPHSGLSLDYTPDFLGRPGNLKAKNGSSTLYDVTYQHDDSGRLGRVTANGLTANYHYHSTFQQLDQLAISPEGSSTPTLYHTRTFDALGRLVSTASHNGSTASGFAAYSSTSYALNDLDQRTQATSLDKSAWNYGYNSKGEVTKAVQKNAAAAPLGGRSLGYAFDGIGNRTAASFGGDSSGGNTRNISYTPNALNQYANITSTPSLFVTGTAPVSDSVTVNSQGTTRQSEYFWKELTAPVSTSAQSLAINVTSGSITQSGSHTFPPQSFSPTYDLDGNLTADGLLTYEWDEENRLTKATSVLPEGPVVTYIYDSQSRLISSTTSSTSTFPPPAFSAPISKLTYLYDGWNRIAEFSHSALPTPNSTLLKTYTWGTDLSGSPQGAGGVGGLLWGRFPTTPLNNPQPSPLPPYISALNHISLVNASTKQLSATYDYGPFGEVLKAIGPMAKQNPYRFSTKPQDEVTGLLYYGYRWYDARTGRWPSRDPIEENGFINIKKINKVKLHKGGKHKIMLNLYAFIDNSALSSIDFNGLDRRLVGGAHLEVQIDDWSIQDGKYVQNGSHIWGFGPRVSENQGVVETCGKCLLSVVIVSGEVYGIHKEESVNGETIYKTSPCDDLRARNRLDNLKKDPEFYNVLVNNCRNFARGFLAYGIDGTGGIKQEPCYNPDGSLWIRNPETK